MDTRELIGLFIWLMFQRHDGIVHFKNDEIKKYPGMDRMQVAMEVADDGITIFVVKPDNDPTATWTPQDWLGPTPPPGQIGA